MAAFANPGGKMEQQDQATLFRRAEWLALFTIGYNIVEGLVSIWFGLADETIALFGFGADSFVEVISGIGIWHMLLRSRGVGVDRDPFERRALRITGSAFYLLTAGLTATALVNLVQGRGPETTVWGVIVSLVSIAFMWLLLKAKVRVGTALGSPAILADAACSRACLYLSVVLLVASLGYELTGLPWLDAVGALGIAWFAFKEGREAFMKAKNGSCGCSCSCGGSASSK